jgi:HKD family nuclease
MKSLTLPYLSQCKLSPFGRIYHVFHKLLSTTRLAKEFYHFVDILSPFGNELMKHKLREVDAMHEIKIRVLHRLYQQIFKITMLNKMLRLHDLIF